MMDDDMIDDLAEAMNSIEDAEAMSVFFPILRKAVVIDTRSNEKKGPMVMISPMAGSPQERLRGIRRLRPEFPRLRGLTLIPWPRDVESLVSMGVWDRIVKRFRDAGQPGAVAACEEGLLELRRLEKAEFVAAVRGDSYHTIWSSRG